MNKQKFKRNEFTFAVRRAFTLAEVLITIGIIGVVAVLVVVPFMRNINEKDMATSATVFEKRFEEALRVMNTQDTLAGYSKTEDFVQALSKNFKISKICNNTELKQCFNPKIFDAEENEIKTNNFRISDNFGVNFDTNIVGLRFANGTTALLAYNPKCKSNPTDNTLPVLNCVSMVYDTNGNGRPNQISSDVRLVNASLDDVSGGDAVIAKINGVKITKIAKISVYGYVDCKDTESEDYEYCYNSTSYSTDYWSGAARYCGGKDKMASEKDLTKIAQYLYNNNSISSSNASGLTLDTNKATELKGYGFTAPTFYVWSSSLDSSTDAFYRIYEENKTSWTKYHHASGRGNNYMLAVCVKH